VILSNERILIVAAHPDDETIGMGATIHKSNSLGSSTRVIFLSDGVSARDLERESLDKRRSSSLAALEILDCRDVHFSDFPDNAMDTVPLIEVVKVIERHIQEFDPTIIFTHFPLDLNVDHRVTSQATLTSTRPKSKSRVKALFFFEVQSSTEWNFGNQQFRPDLFVDISSCKELKARALEEYRVEMEDFPEARSIEGIAAKNVMRGVTVGVESAEAFQIAFIKW
jgi:LmbE family N-acetylglucosaminyl deacetylase